jgi:hypothetical protein
MPGYSWPRPDFAAFWPKASRNDVIIAPIVARHIGMTFAFFLKIATAIFGRQRPTVAARVELLI